MACLLIGGILIIVSWFVEDHHPNFFWLAIGIVGLVGGLATGLRKIIQEKRKNS